MSLLRCVVVYTRVTDIDLRRFNTPLRYGGEGTVSLRKKNFTPAIILLHYCAAYYKIFTTTTLVRLTSKHASCLRHHHIIMTHRNHPETYSTFLKTFSQQNEIQIKTRFCLFQTANKFPSLRRLFHFVLFVTRFENHVLCCFEKYTLKNKSYPLLPSTVIIIYVYTRGFIKLKKSSILRMIWK